MSSGLASLEIVDQILASPVFTSLHGWCSVEKARRVARLVAERGPCPRVVEVGVFGGRVVVAAALAIKHCLPSGLVDGIDPFTASAALEGTQNSVDAAWWGKVDYPAILQSARAGISRLGLDPIVRLILQRSQDVVDTYADKSIDVFSHDGNHSVEVSCLEVASWAPKMKPGAWWVFDDTNWPSTKLAQTQLVEQQGFVLREDHESWAVFQAPL
jgi:hypothetical protein